MEKIIKIDGKEIKLKSNAALPLKYKFQFHREAFQDLGKLNNVMGKNENDITQLELEVFYNFLWILAKTAEPSIPPLLEWLETYDSLPIMDIIPEIIDMIMSNLTTIKKK